MTELNQALKVIDSLEKEVKRLTFLKNVHEERIERLYQSLHERENQLDNAINEQIVIAKQLDSFKGFKCIEDVVCSTLIAYDGSKAAMCLDGVLETIKPPMQDTDFDLFLN